MSPILPVKGVDGGLVDDEDGLLEQGWGDEAASAAADANQTRAPRVLTPTAVPGFDGAAAMVVLAGFVLAFGWNARRRA